MKKVKMFLGIFIVLGMMSTLGVNAAEYSLNNVTIPKNQAPYRLANSKMANGNQALYTSAMSRAVQARIVQNVSPIYITQWYSMTINSTFNWTTPKALTEPGIPELDIRQSTDWSYTSTYSGIWFY